MSGTTQEQKTPNDPFSQRVEWYVNMAHKIGWPAVILGVALWWAKPHMDDLINDHRLFLKSTSETQQKQTEILQRVETKTDDASGMLRDIRDTVVPHAVGVRAKPAPMTAHAGQ